MSVSDNNGHWMTSSVRAKKSRAGKIVRMRVVWGVFDNANKRIEVYDYNKKHEAEEHMAKLMSKSELIQKIADQHSNVFSRKDLKGVIESLATIGYSELKKSGAFLVPGFAKFVVIKKPATKERSGINPFTKEPTIFKAKPARKIIRARPVKAAKDAVS